MALMHFMRLSVKLTIGFADPRGHETGFSNVIEQPNSGCPILRAFCEGWDQQISTQAFAYPTLCKERKGWGTRLFVVLPAVPNTNRGLIENFETHVGPKTGQIPGFLLRSTRQDRVCWLRLHADEGEA